MKQTRIYKKSMTECIEEAKQTLKKRYITENVQLLALQLWWDSSELVEAR